MRVPHIHYSGIPPMNRVQYAEAMRAPPKPSKYMYIYILSQLCGALNTRMAYRQARHGHMAIVWCGGEQLAAHENQ